MVCTYDHPILTPSGWKQAGRLSNLDTIAAFSLDLEKCLFSGDCTFDRVKSINKHENVEIADITVDHDCHSFITGSGLVVHNSSMGKQAISIYSSGYNSRLDTNSHVLVYGHRPLVETKISRYIGMDKNPHGLGKMFGGLQRDSSQKTRDALVT